MTESKASMKHIVTTLKTHTLIINRASEPAFDATESHALPALLLLLPEPLSWPAVAGGPV